MIEAEEDLWRCYEQGHAVCVTTNGERNGRGHAIMGRGTARQAADRIPGLAVSLGLALQRGGNHVFWFKTLRLFSFPVKHRWAEQADPDLIRRSAQELMAKMREIVWEVRSGDAMKRSTDLDLLIPKLPVYLPRPGCGNGGLTWEAVAPLLKPVLSDDVAVIDRPLRRVR